MRMQPTTEVSSRRHALAASTGARRCHEASLLVGARRRLALAACDIVFLLITSCMLMATSPSLAFAYVDPSVMTYTIQALAGVAVALSAVFGVVYRRMRKKMSRALHIDENAGKMVEPDVSRVETQDLPAANRRMAEFWLKEQDSSAPKKLGYGRRFIRALLASFFTLGAVMFLAPLEMVVANSHSLIFSLNQVWVPIVLGALVFSIAMAALLALFKNRAFDIALSVVVAIGVCFWLQSFFLNRGLPAANGAPIEWSSIDYWSQTIVSTIVWVVVIAGCVVAARFATKSFRVASLAVCTVAIAITLIGAGLILTDDDQMAKARSESKIFVTQEGIHDLSASDNIVVFVLDMFDTNGFLGLLAQRPLVAEAFCGFTFYPDSVGSIVPTHYALPYLLTASWPSANESFADYMGSRYADSTFLSDLHDAGYDLGIYTDTMGDRKEWADVASLTINQHPLSRESGDGVDWWGTIAVMTKAALYRDAPWVLKPYFWFYTDDINNAMMPGGITDLAAIPYVINDSKYHESLVEHGLSVVDRGSKGSFRLIHLNGAHWPYTLTSDMQTQSSTSYNDQAQGVLNIVADYIDQMKKLGLYDSATIIITADHGVWDWNHDKLEGVTSPLLLVKPAQSAALDAVPMQTSDVQTGHIDFHATIMKAACGSTAGYGTSVVDVTPGNRVRKFLYPLHNGRVDTAVVEYVVNGYALDLENWTPSGVVWELDR